VNSVTVSRNVHLEAEHTRTRAMVWHWDGIADDTIKMILYLSPVTRNDSGCFMVMQHNVTGVPFQMRRTPMWGTELTTSPVPRPWLAEMLHTGYRPHCITGLAGALIAFNTNIVHRGSRPSKGRYRDVVLIEVKPLAHVAKGGLNMEAPARRHSVASAAGSPGDSQVANLSAKEPTLPLRGSTQRMPMVGFGTANRGKASKGPILVRSLRNFFSLGGRLVDTAQMYRNHAEIGTAMSTPIGSPLEAPFVVSKVNTDRRFPGFVNTAPGVHQVVKATLRDLRRKQIDAMLIHMPWQNSAAEQMAVWRGLIEARNAGKVAHIGMSNFGIAQIERLVNETSVWPQLIEVEFHPWVSKHVRELVQWCQAHEIAVIGYGSLGGSKNKTGLEQRTSDAVAEVASAHQVSTAQVLLRYVLQHGVAVIPGATSREHIADNLEVRRASFALSTEEMRHIESGEKPARFRSWKGLCADGNTHSGMRCID